jgi:hypothetical protein
MCPQRSNSRHSTNNPLGVLLLLLFLPLFVAALAMYFLIGLLLHVSAWCWWGARGKDVLLVYSDSPIWQNYVEQELLPMLTDRAVVLNWSERRNWTPSLAVWAFRYFGGSRGYNPLAVVFRPFRRARTFRYYEPFRDYKHGKSERVAKMTEELLATIGRYGAMADH